MKVVFPVRLCMIRWLPRCRAAANRFRSRIWQTSSPERTRSLPNRNLDLRDEDLGAQTVANFGRVRSLEEQRKRFYQIRSGLFDRRALTCNVEFRTKRHKSIVFSLDNSRQALRLHSDPSLQQLTPPDGRLSQMTQQHHDFEPHGPSDNPIPRALRNFPLCPPRVLVPCRSVRSKNSRALPLESRIGQHRILDPTVNGLRISGCRRDESRPPAVGSKSARHGAPNRNCYCTNRRSRLRIAGTSRSSNSGSAVPLAWAAAAIGGSS